MANGSRSEEVRSGNEKRSGRHRGLDATGGMKAWNRETSLQLRMGMEKGSRYECD